MGLRAEVRRLSGDRVRRRRRSISSPVARSRSADTSPSSPLPAGPLRARRRARDPRGRRARGVRRSPEPAPPRGSRVRMLAAETPVVAEGLRPSRGGIPEALGETLQRTPRAPGVTCGGPRGRRKAAAGSIELTPLQSNLAKAAPWLEDGEGVIAKQLAAPYRPGSARGWSRSSASGRRIASWSAGGREGGGYRGIADPRALRGGASGGRAHVGLQRSREAGAGRQLGPYETGERGSADPSRWAPAATWSGSSFARSSWSR